MSEYIKREDAIKALCINECYGVLNCIDKGFKCDSYKSLINIPPADVVERKHGEWIDSVDRTYMDRPMAECSECGWYINPYWINEYNFCPNCGARMKGADDD